MGTGFLRGDAILFLVIQAEAKTVAERRKGSLGGIGFRSFERDIVHLARRCSVAFTGAMTFPNDGRAIRMHGDPDPGDVDRQEGPAVFAQPSR